ncbi:DMT family transporter [Chelatococcus sp. SYSU_G07232]|uniref:DMT family transporter n=1 Tax=Chelatococcus albus TaxID=3047466 RepID=A0ABT7AH67_9HYPH|nr:DMT family transporter [Chelatococcus sp. SYSU_G07232]MDJ1158425.1 DMT family transporter [Chelatococcus sp. SYSU_G07232]
MSIAAECAPARRSFDAVTAAALAVTIIAWASAFPAIRVGLAAFGPLELGALRFAIAAVPAALFLALTRPPLPTRGEWWRFAAGGLFFVALYTLLLNAGERTVSAGAASFIINVNPIITAVLALMILGEQFGRRAWAGTALSFAGIGLIALGEGQGMRIDEGALLILGAALCNSVTTVAQKPLFARHRPLTVSASHMVIGALILAPGLPGGLTQVPAAAPEALAAVIYLGLVPSLIAYGAWAVALSRLPAARASNFMYCVPPVATAMGFLWLGEVPGTLGLVGGAMALGGVIVVNLKR